MKAMMMTLLLVMSAAVVATPSAAACNANSVDDLQACGDRAVELAGEVVNIAQGAIGTVLRAVCERVDEGEDCE